LFKPDGSGHLCYENISWNKNGDLHLGSLKDDNDEIPTVTIGDGAWIVTAAGNIKAANNNAKFNKDGSGYIGGLDANQKYKGLSWDKFGDVTINSQLKYNFQVVDLNTNIIENSKPTSMIISDVNKYLIQDSSNNPSDGKKIYLNWWASNITVGAVVDVDIINGTNNTIILAGVGNSFAQKNTSIYIPLRKEHDFKVPQSNFTLGKLSYTDTAGLTNNIYLLPGTTLQLQLYKDTNNLTTGYIKNISAFQILSNLTSDGGVVDTNVLCSIAPEHNNAPANNALLSSSNDGKQKSEFTIKHIFEADYEDTIAYAFLTACKDSGKDFKIRTKLTNFKIDANTGTPYSSASSNYASINYFDNTSKKANHLELYKLNKNYTLPWIRVAGDLSTLEKALINGYQLDVTKEFLDLKLPYAVTLNYYVPEYGKLFKSKEINFKEGQVSINNAFIFDDSTSDETLSNLIATLFNSTHKSLDVYTFLTFRSV
jgi:hypothetical protein